MSSQKKRWTVTIATLLCLMATGVWVRARVIPPIQFAQEHNQVVLALRELQYGETVGKGHAQWNQAIELLIGGFNNVYFSLSHVSLGEIHSFRKDLSSRLHGEDYRSTETLVWVWKRIGDSGELGKEYVNRYQPDFDAALKAFENATGS